MVQEAAVVVIGLDATMHSCTTQQDNKEQGGNAQWLQATTQEQDYVLETCIVDMVFLLLKYVRWAAREEVCDEFSCSLGLTGDVIKCGGDGNHVRSHLFRGMILLKQMHDCKDNAIQ